MHREEDEVASWVRLEASSQSQISSWSYDADLAERTKREINSHKQRVKDVFKKMQAAKNLDLCFMVDVTSSMRPHINAVRDQIHAIVDKLTKTQNLRFMVDIDGSMVPQINAVGDQIHAIADKLKTSNSWMDLVGNITMVPDEFGNVVRFASSSIVKKIRLAFVGYRDFGDSPQFEVLDFCESVDDFHAFCNRIKASGGGDAAEDVFGGLEKAIGLKWSTDGSTRMLFHIADQPCHGSAYHDHDYGYGHKYDQYPGGDPNGRSINFLLGDLQKTEYHFGRITNSTDKMIKEFSKIYGDEIVVCDIKDPNLLLDSIISSSSIAVSKAFVLAPARRMHFAAGLSYDRVEPDWNAVAKTAGLFLTYELPKSIKLIFNGIPLKQKQPVKAIVQLAPKPFAKGRERVAYYGRDLSLPSKPIDIVMKKYTTAMGFIDSAPQYAGAIQLQTIAAYLASIFSASKKVNHSSIKFLKSQMFGYEDPLTGRGIYMSCELRYPADCDFLRFSNNIDYSMLEETAKAKGVDPKFVEQLMAFSHWTYQISRGYLMVVDLQGIICTDAEGNKNIELTDPAIHCTDLTRFGCTNLGIKGMKSFFSRHVCNEFCAQMGLTLPPATMMMGVDVDE